MESLGNGVYLHTLVSAVFPVPGDSIRATSLARDGLGNAGNMVRFLPVQGKGIQLASGIAVEGGATTSIQGMPATVEPASEKVLFRFGYVRGIRE